ncbi:MAG: GAF domain-containing protein, partial [candidate division NC10 bacterium]|nr:GAF domain-containing protein [candidate division NC10 bacterium]
MSQAASVSAVMIGSLALVGWWLDVTVLKTSVLGLPTMHANAALTFVLIGVSLWLLRAESTGGWRRRVAQVCASIVVLIGLLVISEYLYEYLSGEDLGIDRLLLQARGAPAPHLNPGRMAFVSALNFVLLGGAILLLDVPSRRGYQHAPFLAVVVTASALLTLVAYLYGGAAIHQAYPFVTVAPHTALLFLALSIGVVFARAQHRIVDVVMSDTTTAAAMRRLLVVSILLPILAGWVRLKGQQFGFFGTEFGLALIVVFAIIALTASIYWQTMSLIRAEEYQHGINEVSTALGRSMTLEDTFPVFAATVKKVVSCDRICVVVREGEWLVAVLSVADPPLRCFHEQGWRPLGETAVEWVMAHKLPRLTRDLPREIAFADEAFIAREGIHSTLILPLLVGGKAVGSLTLDNKTPGAFTQDHVSVLSGFTEPLASAVRNAQLYAQVVRYTQ